MKKSLTLADLELKEAKKFVQKYLSFRNKDHSRKSTCDPFLHASWMCCRYHKSLQRKSWELDGEAASLMRVFSFSSKGAIGSVTWWRDFEKATGITVPVELRT